MKPVFGTIAFATLLSPAVAAAQEASAPSTVGSERRLTPEQVETILAEAAAKRQAAEKRGPVEELAADDTELPVAPQVHGQVGFSVGTGGYREAFGTAIYPLGDDGLAIINLDFVNWGQHRWPR